MRYKKVDASLERRILIGLIVSGEFLKEIQSFYSSKFLSSPVSQKIAKWCFEFYEKYEKPPQKEIKNIFEAQVNKQELEEDEVDFIEDILASLSDQWDHEIAHFNVDVLLDDCEELFKLKSLKDLAEKLENEVDKKDPRTAEQILDDYSVVARPSVKGVNPLTDADKIFQAFEKRSTPLFKVPGALGRMMNDQFFREGFIAFQGAEKSGKSYVLQELAIRATRNRCNVAIFEMGDMTEADRIIRIHSWLSKKPYVRRKTADGTVKVKIPTLTFDDESEPVVNFKEKEMVMLSPHDAIKMGKKWEKLVGTNRMRISEHYSDTTNVQDIMRILDYWKKKDGWIPDVIVVDYVDILAPERSGLSERDKINASWLALRTLSQKYHALVMTVTQADAGSYNVMSQSLQNFSGDKRKYGHITAMYAIDKTPQEKSKNIYRISPLLVREGFFPPELQVGVVHCLDLGRPYWDSFETKAPIEPDSEEQ